MAGYYRGPIEKHGNRILVFLQNAYDKGTLAKGWNPTRWRQEFKRSRSGKRLEVLLGYVGINTCRFANIAPGVGNGADSALVPSRRHVRRAIKRVDPKLIIACGDRARETLTDEWGAEEWEGDLVCVPHPTYRLLTNELLEEANKLIAFRLICAENPGWAKTMETMRWWRPVVSSAQLRGDEPMRIVFRQARDGVELEEL